MTQQTFDIRTADDLYRLKKRTDLQHITLWTDPLKYQGLTLHAARTALFALKPGGQIAVHDGGDTQQQIAAYRFGWPSVRSLLLTALGKTCTVHEEGKPGLLTFTRTAEILSPGWSAGIIFSGREEEVPQMVLCLEGLQQQAELQGPEGEVLVCGPEAGAPLLSDFTNIRYIPFEYDGAGPFPISAKKNHLMRAMKFPRKLVLHARIVLDPNVLANAPREFDILSPNVEVDRGKGREPNICFTSLDANWPLLMPTRLEGSTLSTPVERYLSLLKGRKPYVDGGAFAVTDPVLSECELNPHLRWGDCEDVEWCFRAQTLGYMIDLAPAVTALSSTHKFAVGASHSQLTALTRKLGRIWRYGRNRLSYAFGIS